ncbi:DUF5066 family protein [Xanthocytophaga flava]|uniref:DUF5066 family protein n=1 Tax=Xanthocytophaga flava TaxID=3048013 RepID=UPI0028D8F29E|nr:DUF5066 family protein [Xanthocytophaga flavus]MDJ1473147.1 DUF5066 family protein [Xanthocytophaga flavus]
MELLAYFVSQLPLINLNETLAPMPEEEIERIRISQFRNGSGALMPLPESVKAILRYDRHFKIAKNYPPLLNYLLTSLDANYRVPSVTITQLIRQDSLIGVGLNSIPESLYIWHDTPDMPALLPVTHFGDQIVMLYITNLTKEGEYPVARFDNEPCVWISQSSLIDYVLSVTGKASDIQKADFEKKKKALSTKYKAFVKQEAFSQNPELTPYFNALND